MSVKIHSRYDLPVSPAVTFVEPSLAQQHFRDECDINNIMDRYARTGVLGDVTATRQPSFGDFSADFDYQIALNQLIDAQDMFASLPARLRDRFANDPSKLLAFVSDEANREEAIKLGLIEKPIDIVEVEKTDSGQLPT